MSVQVRNEEWIGIPPLASGVVYQPNDGRAETNVNAELDRINTTLSAKLDSKYQIKVIWSGTATFISGRTKLLKSLYSYDVFIPLTAVDLSADSDVVVSLDASGNTIIGLPFSTGFSGNLNIEIYGIGYNN